ncbi:J domain-containing protein [Marinobacter gelidimuriae]|uniref:molecular chaperone DnaJ n=1 Tax=Marinobacter gelidimuriae TaxID=2739064 RepID=UPI000370FE7D|nr:molecular chaperone DnaJ [Marinobacter gelidimuriae]
MHWILGIALAAGLFVVLRQWGTLSPEKKKAATWKAILIGGGGLLLLMVLTGRIHVLTAAVAALLPLLRKLPALLRYLPFIQRTLNGQASNGQASNGQASRNQGSTDGQERQRTGADVAGQVSEREACEILGVTPGCNRDDIVMAHRRLMQKIHPDRGGNDYLAAKVNDAKRVLLHGAKT